MIKRAGITCTGDAKWAPNVPDTYFHMGQAYEKAGHKKDAKMAYLKVIEVAPDSEIANRAARAALKTSVFWGERVAQLHRIASSRFADIKRTDSWQPHEKLVNGVTAS